MVTPGTVIGWKLDRDQRELLLERFPPRYSTAVADHVTLETEASRKPLPPAVEAMLVGRTDDGSGVEAMIVALDGSTDRPDGSTYHLTWSLSPGRRAIESNDVIRKRGWERFEAPLAITLEPARF
jgi:hypothetical protein